MSAFDLQRERFLVPAHGPDARAAALAFQAMEILCQKHDSDAVICVPVLRNVESTVLREVLTEKQLRMLAHGKVLSIANQYALRMCSTLNISRFPQCKIVLAVFALKALLDKLEAARWWKALVVVPWMPGDVELWREMTSPKVIA